MRDDSNNKNNIEQFHANTVEMEIKQQNKPHNRYKAGRIFASRNTNNNVSLLSKMLLNLQYSKTAR